MQPQDFTRNPKAALWRFVGALMGVALFWWAASIGWPGARFLFWVFVICAVIAFFDVIRAHRAWKISTDISIQAQKTGTRHDTNPKGSAETDEDGWPKR